MPDFIDQTRRRVTIPAAPKRIISLVPSQTELLYALGLDTKVIGITKFCTAPPAWHRTKTRVGGTKDLHLERIGALEPDLIIANKEENTKEQIEQLANRFPVWVSDVNNLSSALSLIRELGTITGRHEKAADIAEQIVKEFAGLPVPEQPLSTAYLIWQNPFMTVGGDTFIHAMLEAAGFANVFKTHTRYPEITLNDLREKDCRLLLLSSEPYPFGPAHQAALAKELPQMQVELVDGTCFSWYGSRLLDAPACFRRLQAKITELRNGSTRRH